MSINRLNTSGRFIVGILSLALLSITAITIIPAKGALALSGSEFDPSNIISDTVFFNPDTMDSNQIQAFLNAKVPVCDTYHASSGGNNPPFTCLKDYTQAVPNAGGDAYCAYIGGNGTVYSAAQIIYIVSKSCGINPQVMIVLLQKEQALVTDTWPWNIQYRSATGYGCPDTAECDSTYYGYFNQVYNAARQFKRYVAQPQLFNYASGRNSFIPYQANRPDCGGTNVTIQNKATAALYNYTPYQPNPAALTNLYGTGNECSAYGNRNFWRMFNDWFGSTQGDLVRTSSDATVYLMGDGYKYPISSLNVLNDYSRLGPIRFVSDQFLSSRPTGGVLQRMIQTPDQSLYFVNANIKLPFTSCGGDVVDYGYTCQQGQFAKLTFEQANKLVSGPAVTKLILSNVSGTIYYMNAGKKLPIPSWNDLTSLKIPITWNVLTEGMLSEYQSGPLLYGPGSMIKSSSSATVYLVKDVLQLYSVTSFIFPNELGLTNPVRTASDENISGYTKLPNNFSNRLKCGSIYYLGVSGHSYPMSNEDLSAYNLPLNTFIDGGNVCNNIPKKSSSVGRYLRSTDGTIYFINDISQKQSFASYSSYVNHQAGRNTSGYVQASTFLIDSFSVGSSL